MNSSEPLNPLVLVHGLTDTDTVFKPLSAYLRQQGWEVNSVNLIPSNGDCELDRLAHQLDTYIESILPHQQPFDLVGFSMGGIVSRYYVQRLGGLDRVQRFVTIASPHNGTLTAYLSQRPGCLQMRPNSPFITSLNRDLPMLEKLNFTSIWTPMDLMIVPATSSQTPVGRNIQVNVPLHAWMVQDPKGLEAVAVALREKVRHQQN